MLKSCSRYPNLMLDNMKLTARAYTFDRSDRHPERSKLIVRAVKSTILSG